MINTSKFSGKCDCYDWIFMSSENLAEEELFERFKNKGSKIYKYKPYDEQIELDLSKGDIQEQMKQNWIEIKYDSIKDLVPYYPYIVCIGTCSDGKSTLILSSESYVDSSEKESLQFMLKEILRYYNRAKRKKESFDKDYVLSKVCWNHYNEDAYKELIDRVDKYGKKADIKGIELSMSKYYREELEKEKIKYENY